MSSETTAPNSIIEGHSFKLQPAPAFKRGMASAIDLGIVTAIFYVLFIGGAIFYGAFAISLTSLIGEAQTGDNTAYLLLLIVPLVLGLIVLLGFMHYFFIRSEYRTGQTPGKKFMGLKVVSLRSGGGKITLRQAVIRDLARWYIDMLLFLPALIAMGLTRNRQRVGDLIADTMVVYNEKDEQEQTFLFLLRRDYEALRVAFGPVRLPADSLERFTAFSNQYYLMGLPEVTAALNGQADEWDGYLRANNPSANRLALDQNTLLRFVAEMVRRERDKILVSESSITSEPPKKETF